jgi:flagellar hook assembly protein FlgD
MAGQKIHTLVNADYSAGYYTVSWNTKDKNGNMLPGGIYLYQLQTNNNKQSKRMSFLR